MVGIFWWLSYDLNLLRNTLPHTNLVSLVNADRTEYWVDLIRSIYYYLLRNIYDLLGVKVWIKRISSVKFTNCATNSENSGMWVLRIHASWSTVRTARFFVSIRVRSTAGGYAFVVVYQPVCPQGRGTVYPSLWSQVLSRGVPLPPTSSGYTAGDMPLLVSRWRIFLFLMFKHSEQYLVEMTLGSFVVCLFVLFIRHVDNICLYSKPSPSTVVKTYQKHSFCTSISFIKLWIVTNK